MANHSSITDDGAKFQIIPNTRKIVVPQSCKVIGTIGDHNSEQVTFQCPKTIDGHDIANCSDKYISWENAKGEPGSYEIQSDKIITDGENIYFPWVIESGVTVAAGNVLFSVHFEDRTADDVMLYKWGTTSCKDCQILDTLSHKKSGVTVPEGYTKPTGTLDITANGNYNVSAYASAAVNIKTSGGTVEVIPDGYIKPEGTAEITENGSHNVKSYETATVNVTPKLQEKTVTVNCEVTPDEGFDGLSKVTVNVEGGTDLPEGYLKPTGTINVTANGTVNVANYELANVNVTVTPKLQEKEVTVNGEVEADEGYDGLSKVVVNVDLGHPIDVATADEMSAILEAASESDIGKVYKYTGETTETYENGALYVVEVAE